nr:ferric reductase-like transmembrane domain-containing protein [Motilibacter aurantiacus]
MAAYVLLVLAPMAFVLVAPDAARRSGLTNASDGIGFSALAMLALQLVLPARLRLFTRPFGVDVLLRFHRLIGGCALALAVLHVVLLMADDPGRLALLNPVTAPWRARAGVVATGALALLVALSLWRRPLRMPYEAWRGSHLLLGVLVVAAALGHVVGVGGYLGLGAVQASVAALAVLGAGAVFALRVARPFAAAGRPYQVEQVTPERGGATTLRLRAVGHGGVPFRPGQFAWLKTAGSPYALEEHPFSFASSAARPAQVELTVKAVGDFTTGVRALEPGSRVLLDGPHGSFSPARPDAAYVLVAGGIGITPVMSLLRTFADERDPRSLVLVYASRRWEDVTFREELDDLAGRLDLRVVHVLSDPPEGWPGERGRVEARLLARVLPADVRERNAFVCGPPPLVVATVEALRELGVPAEQVHAERFADV